MRQEAYYCTAEELVKLGKDAIPPQLISNTHLIYSSPATLAFNSPGAEGLGKACRACGTRIYYADRGTRMLRKEYFYDQFDEGIS